ncbi:MAG: DUF1834 family protein [Elusimicrobia bacterium]|nr:DUF1834 family protein [Elusimicrobiota bacterium]
MLAEIENAVITRLAEKAPTLKQLDTAKSEVVLINTPAYTLAILKGTAEPITQSENTKQHINLSIWLAFKNIKSDKDRRHGAFPVVEAIAQILLDQKLGLEIKGLKYTGFTDVTDEAERAGGMAVYQLDFKTWYVVSKMDEEGTQALLSVGLNYLLNGSTTAAAQDVVTLQTGG